MTARLDYHGIKLSAPSTSGFWLGDYQRAKAEVKRQNYELYRYDNNPNQTIITTPYLREIYKKFNKAMHDDYLVTFTVSREQNERIMGGLVESEQHWMAIFERNIMLAPNEQPLRGAFSSLNEQREEIVKQLIDLKQRAKTLGDYFSSSYEDYCIRSGKYISQLSKRLKMSLYQPYTETDFPMIAQARSDMEHYAAKAEEYRQRTARDNGRMLERISELQQELQQNLREGGNDG